MALPNVHGKNIRERAMSLIAIAHPKFRPQLIEEAKNSISSTKIRPLSPEKGRISRISGNNPDDQERSGGSLPIGKGR